MPEDLLPLCLFPLFFSANFHRQRHGRPLCKGPRPAEKHSPTSLGGQPPPEKRGPCGTISPRFLPCLLQKKGKKQIFLKKGLHFPFEYCIINNVVTGCGAVGSALDWGSRGREFKSRHSDQISTIVLIRRYLKLSCFFFW